MPQKLDNKSILRIIRNASIVLGVCLLVWIWGNHKKVDVAMQFVTELKNDLHPTRLDLTFYNADNEVSKEIMITVPSGGNAVDTRASFRPGPYSIHAMINTTEGQNVAVEQWISVPNDDATMTIYLRN